MTIQIFGRKKCKDTRKAQRFFQERKIAFHFVDLDQREMSPGEFDSVVRAVGGLENLVNWQSKDRDGLAHVRYRVEDQRGDFLRQAPKLMRTPIVRRGARALVGYDEEGWRAWAEEERRK